MPLMHTRNICGQYVGNMWECSCQVNTLITLVVRALHSLLDDFLGRRNAPTAPAHICVPVLPLSKAAAFHGALSESRDRARAACAALGLLETCESLSKRCILVNGDLHTSHLARLRHGGTRSTSQP